MADRLEEAGGLPGVQVESSQVDGRQDETQQSTETTTAGQDLELYEKSIKPLLAKTCFECHSDDNAEGGFRADELDPDPVNGEDLAWWLEVYSVVSKGEMPPDSVDFSDEHRTLLVDWLATRRRDQ